MTPGTDTAFGRRRYAACRGRSWKRRGSFGRSENFPRVGRNFSRSGALLVITFAVGRLKTSQSENALVRRRWLSIAVFCQPFSTEDRPDPVCFRGLFRSIHCIRDFFFLRFPPFSCNSDPRFLFCSSLPFHCLSSHYHCTFFSPSIFVVVTQTRGL